MAKKGSTKSSKKSKTVTTTTEVTVIEERKTNPHGVNQYTGPDPRQALFFQYLFAIGTPTFSNIFTSAIAAGFEESYARVISAVRPKWFYEFICREDLATQAEDHMKEVMALPNVQQVIGAFGPLTQKIVVKEDTGTVYKTGKRAGQAKFKNVKKEIPVVKHDTALIKAKNEIAKLVLPAYKPDIYAKKQTNNNKFVFNMAIVKERYKT